MVTAQININEASTEELTTIKGIGPALADRIVAYRQENGPLTSLAELTAVKGISAKMVDQLAAQLTTNSTEPLEVERTLDDDLVVDNEAAAGETVATGAADTMADWPADKDDLAESMAAESMAAESMETESMEAESMEATDFSDSVQILPELDAESDPEPAPDFAARSADNSPPADAQPTSLTPPQPAVMPGPSAASFGFRELALVAGSALAGAILTLLVLTLLNGTLRFAQRTSVTESQRLTEADLTNLATELNGLGSALGDELATAQAQGADLSSAMATAAAGATLSAEAIDDLGSDMGAVSGHVADLQSEAAALATAIVTVDERVDNVGVAAERFDSFLLGLGDLLQQTLVTSEATMTPTPPEATPTATGVPTRTPRPTATPIVQPSATPAD